MKCITFYYIAYFFVYVSANNSEGIFKLICSKCHGTCCIGTAIQSNFIITTKSCAESCQYININNKKVAINKTHVYPHNFPYKYIGGSVDSIALIELDSDVAKVPRHVIAIPPESAFGLEAEVIRFNNKISKSLALVKHCEIDFTFYDGYYVCTTKASGKLQMGAPLLLNNRLYGVLGKGFANARDYSFMAVTPAIDWIKSAIHSPSSPVNGIDLNVTGKDNETISSDIPKQENGITSASEIDEELENGPTIYADEPKTTLLPEKEYESNIEPRETEKKLDTDGVETVNEQDTTLPVTATPSDIGSLETKKASDAGPSETGAVSDTGSPENEKESKGLDSLEIESEPSIPETGNEPEYGTETQIKPETPETETGTTSATGSPETKKESDADPSETGEKPDDVTPKTGKEPDNSTQKTENELDTSTAESENEPTDLPETGNELDNGTPKTEKAPDSDTPDTENDPDIGSLETRKEPDNSTPKTENELDTSTPESENEPTVLPETGNELDNGTPKTEKEPDSDTPDTENDPDIGSLETRKEPDNSTPKTENELDTSTPESENEPTDLPETGNELDNSTPKTEKAPDSDTLDTENDPDIGSLETRTEPDNSTPKNEKEPDSGDQETENKSDIGSKETRKEPDNDTPKTDNKADSGTPGTENVQDNATSKSGNEPDTIRPETKNEPDTGPPETGKESDQDHFENNARNGPSRMGRQGNLPLRYGHRTKSAKNFVPENYLHPLKKQSPATNVMEWFNKYYAGDLRKKKPTFVLTTAMAKGYFADLT